MSLEKEKKNKLCLVGEITNKKRNYQSQNLSHAHVLRRAKKYSNIQPETSGDYKKLGFKQLHA